MTLDLSLPRWFPHTVLGVIVFLFATRNLPWHLDNFDQAKQAFTSYEMVERGNWWFQHTPTERVATKPPLAGWISAVLFYATGGTWWDGAWRLPGFLFALGLVAILWKAGTRLAGDQLGGIVAASCFGLNLFAPRLATLVRTDMMLTFCIFLAGYLVYEKVRRAETWTTRERWHLALVILASMLTKGPIAYAFLLPGIIAFCWIQRRSAYAGFAWSGWWSWFAPLAVFLAWAGVGMWLSDDFYQQVVVKEFLGRFTTGEEAVHRNQPLYFYFVHILHKWLPWSLLLLAALWRKEVRARLRSDPALLWLCCWALGGLIFMSLVPSKRPDRIFPVLPPLCLLMAGIVGILSHTMLGRWSVRQITSAAIGFAFLFSGGYAVQQTISAFRSNQRGLVHFGASAQKAVGDRLEQGAVVNGKDEGLVMYLHKKEFTDLDDAVEKWRAGALDWLVLSPRDLKRSDESLQPYERVLETGKIPKKFNSYVLIRRPGQPPPADVSTPPGSAQRID